MVLEYMRECQELSSGIKLSLVDTSSLSLLHLPKFNLKNLAKRISPSVTLGDAYLRRTPATPLTNAIPSATSSTTTTNTTTTSTPQPQIGV